MKGRSAMPDVTKPLASMPAMTPSGLKSALASAIRGVMEGTCDPQRAVALGKLAAQANAIMRTELDAVRLHHEITGEKTEHAMKVIGHGVASEEGA